jgi:protease I
MAIEKKGPLSGKRVAILVENGFEEVELVEPRKALQEAGAETAIVSPAGAKVRSWRRGEWGDAFPVDEPLERAEAGRYDALLLPGGVMSPDRLRVNERARRLVQAFFEQGKPAAAICHGPWTLIDAGVARGRKLTSWPSLAADLRNAGAIWVDAQVVVDAGLVTSRKPDDLPVFCAKMVEEFAAGRRARHAAAAHERPERMEGPKLL